MTSQPTYYNRVELLGTDALYPIRDEDADCRTINAFNDSDLSFCTV